MYFASDCRWYCINYSFTNKYLSPVQLSGHNTVGQQLPALLDELGGRVFKQLACYTMKYQESDLHLVPYSSLTSANNNVGSCWPTVLRPF